MKMITKEIERKFDRFPLYSQDGKGDDAVVLCKFFNPYGGQSWYVLEAGEVVDGDRELYVFFTNCGECEYSYMMLSDILNCKVPYYTWRMSLERDKWFSGTVADAKKDAYVKEYAMV